MTQSVHTTVLFLEAVYCKTELKLPCEPKKGQFSAAWLTQLMLTCPQGDSAAMRKINGVERWCYVWHFAYNCLLVLSTVFSYTSSFQCLNLKVYFISKAVLRLLRAGSQNTLSCSILGIEVLQRHAWAAHRGRAHGALTGPYRGKRSHESAPQGGWEYTFNNLYVLDSFYIHSAVTTI